MSGARELPTLVARPVASAVDLAAVRELLLEYAASLDTDLGFQDFDAELNSLPGAYQPPTGALLVAEVNDAVVGCVALRPLEPPDVGEIKRLYVRPAARSHGVGRTLTAAILDAARAAGYRRVRLDTLPSQTAAQRMYQRIGFREIPPYRYNPVQGSRFLELSFTTSAMKGPP